MKEIIHCFRAKKTKNKMRLHNLQYGECSDKRRISRCSSPSEHASFPPWGNERGRKWDASLCLPRLLVHCMSTWPSEKETGNSPPLVYVCVQTRISLRSSVACFSSTTTKCWRCCFSRHFIKLSFNVCVLMPLLVATSMFPMSAFVSISPSYNHRFAGITFNFRNSLTHERRRENCHFDGLLLSFRIFLHLCRGREGEATLRRISVSLARGL